MSCAYSFDKISAPLLSNELHCLWRRRRSPEFPHCDRLFRKEGWKILRELATNENIDLDAAQSERVVMHRVSVHDLSFALAEVKVLEGLGQPRAAH